jgi:hypothetical protein
MVKKIFFIFALMLVLPLVSATTLQVNVKTLPSCNVFLNFAEPSDRYQLIESVKAESDLFGNAVLTFSSDRFNEVKIFAQVNQGSEKILFENFGIRSMFEPLYLQLIPGTISDDYRELEEEVVEVEEEINETVADEVAEEEVNVTEEPGITGAAVSFDGSWVFSRITLWIAGIVTVIAIVVVFVVRRSFSGPKIDLPRIYNVKTLPDMPKPKNPIDEEISKTERELETVRSRIERIRKVKDAERKLKEEQEALKRLEEED